MGHPVEPLWQAGLGCRRGRRRGRLFDVTSKRFFSLMYNSKSISTPIVQIKDKLYTHYNHVHEEYRSSFPSNSSRRRDPSTSPCFSNLRWERLHRPRRGIRPKSGMRSRLVVSSSRTASFDAWRSPCKFSPRSCKHISQKASLHALDTFEGMVDTATDGSDEIRSSRLLACTRLRRSVLRQHRRR